MGKCDYQAGVKGKVTLEKYDLKLFIANSPEEDDEQLAAACANGIECLFRHGFSPGAQRRRAVTPAP